MKPDDRKRDVHLLNEDGMVLCNPRDKEASHRAAMGDILIAITPADATCKKCLVANWDNTYNRPVPHHDVDELWRKLRETPQGND